MTEADQKKTPGLQVVVMTGQEDAERALLALRTALVSASAGVPTFVFLTSRGAQWACAKVGAAPDDKELGETMGALLAAGSRVECCSVCLDRFCGDDRGQGLREGIQVAGLASLAQRTTAGVPTLTF